ncbi:hypothetical protein OS128_06555 [Corynebacterium sp. P5848]|uniref:hypothetical protein n=1 Tax=Corynebacterium marambiense TaxID=2765364 RepID=UPI00226089C3|nr:hypothetical protein [Corynebacterium marambiense]MCX7542573.1 hypothetical protein [Corynebacterium marambiense]
MSDVFVVVGGFPDRVLRPLVQPDLLDLNPGVQCPDLVGVFLVFLPSPLPLDEEGLSTVVVDGDLALRRVKFHDTGHGAGEELAVVADDHHGPVIRGDEALQDLQAREIEVIGRLVKDKDAVPGEQNHRQVARAA